MIITQDLLQELFSYNDGSLIWRADRGTRVKSGDIAGHISSRGYIQIKINGKRYYAHRLIYLYHYGYIDENLQIDHINGIKNDNKIENLRLVTPSENQWNRPTSKGYYFNKQEKKWKASICVNSKQKHLGYYNNEDEARNAYLKAKQKSHQIKDR